MSLSTEFSNFIESAVAYIEYEGFGVVDAAEKLRSLPMLTILQQNKIADVIFEKALKTQNVKKYAQLCAILITDWTFNQSLDSVGSLQSIITSKCMDILFHYKSRALNLLIEDKTYMSNCEFICELFHQGVVRKEIVWCFATELAMERKGQQIQGLCEILKTAGPRLTNTYSLDPIIAKLSQLEEQNYSEKVFGEIKDTIARFPKKVDKAEQKTAVQKVEKTPAVKTVDAPPENGLRRSTRWHATHRRILRFSDSESDCRDPSPCSSTSWSPPRPISPAKKYRRVAESTVTEINRAPRQVRSKRLPSLRSTPYHAQRRQLKLDR